MRYEDLQAGSVLAIENYQLCGWFVQDNNSLNIKIPRFVIGSCDFGAYEKHGMRYDCNTPLFYVGNATITSSGSMSRQIRLIYTDEQLGYVEFNDIDKLRDITSEYQG